MLHDKNHHTKINTILCISNEFEEKKFKKQFHSHWLVNA